MSGHWGYEDASGPEHWGSLSPCFALCDQGRAQSPVDIPASATPRALALRINYRAATTAITNNGHSIQLDPPEGSTVLLEGQAYTLKQFHFHAHSEHTRGGAPAPMELHLVHADEAGRLLVLGVLIEVGEPHPALERIFEAMPPEPGGAAQLAAPLDPSALLPLAREAWSYSGSLTTPPCSEEVRWILLSTPIHASMEQIAAFEALYPNNYRPVQPLNGRLS